MHETDGPLDRLAPCGMFAQLPDAGATKAAGRDVNIAAAQRTSACFICSISLPAMWIADRLKRTQWSVRAANRLYLIPLPPIRSSPQPKFVP